jgi:uncharacterized Zn-finger protein
MALQTTDSTASAPQSLSNVNPVSENGSSNENSNTSVSVSTTVVTKKNHVCGECGRSCVSPSKLQRHEATHSKDRPHVCQRICTDGIVCNKSYKDKDNLTKHILRYHDTGNIGNPTPTTSSDDTTPTSTPLQQNMNINDSTTMNGTDSTLAPILLPVPIKSKGKLQHEHRIKVETG